MLGVRMSGHYRKSLIVTFVTLLQIDLFVLLPLYLFTLKSFLPLTYYLKFKYISRCLPGLDLCFSLFARLFEACCLAA